MSHVGIRFKRLILVLGDLAVYQLALLLTLALRYGSIESSTWSLHIVPFSIVGVLWVIGSYVAGLYDVDATRNDVVFFRMYLESMIANLAVALAFFYLVPFFTIAPRTNLFLYVAIVLLLGYGWRLTYNRWIAHSILKHRILFIGTSTEAAKLLDLIGKTPFGFELAAVIETSPGEHFGMDRIAWYSSISATEHAIKEHRIQTILLGHRPEEIPGLKDMLYRTLFTPVSLMDRATLEETVTGRVPLEYVSQTWFLEHLREAEKTWYDSAKRIIDIILSIPVGIFAVATLPVVAALVKLSSPGPILYSQMRVGKMGKPFRIWKYRSMRQDAEVAGRPQFARENDPRITKIGSFLRKTRLDELPQIWNVIRGDMSFIGPRPERPQFVEELTRQMPYYALRHLTKPGLTGWAQVKFPYAGSIEDNLKKLQYDLYYIKNRSWMTDIAILLKTIGIVLRRQGT